MEQLYIREILYVRAFSLSAKLSYGFLVIVFLLLVLEFHIAFSLGFGLGEWTVDLA